MRRNGAILAAGLGTRLRPVTDHCPKPLVPVCGVPLLEYAVAALGRLGVDAIGVNLHHLGDQIPPRLAHRPERLSYVVEAELAGTGGGLRGIAAGLPATTLVCCNGDALFDFDLAAALDAHRRSGAEATLVLRRPRAGEPFGRVAVDATGQVQRIAEVLGREPDRPDLHFGIYTGVQFVEPVVVAALPAAGACDVLRTAYRDRLQAGARIGAHFVADDALWIDVGTPERLLAAQRAVLTAGGRGPGGVAATAAAALPPADARGVRLSPAATVAAGARLEGPCAVLAGARVEASARVGPGSVVDRDAVVGPSADLEGVLVWRGARADGRLRQAIVLPDGAVVPAEAPPA